MLVTAAVFVRVAPTVSGELTVTWYETVTRSPVAMVSPLARVGVSVPGVPAPEGSRRMLPGTNVVLAGAVSEITPPVALAPPMLVTTTL